VISRYEWGVDHLNGREIFPAESDCGRITTGTSEFTLKLRPDNWGVLLRRKLDYSYPNQRAEVLLPTWSGNLSKGDGEEREFGILPARILRFSPIRARNSVPLNTW